MTAGLNLAFQQWMTPRERALVFTLAVVFGAVVGAWHSDLLIAPQPMRTFAIAAYAMAAAAVGLTSGLPFWLRVLAAGSLWMVIDLGTTSMLYPPHDKGTFETAEELLDGRIPSPLGLQLGTWLAAALSGVGLAAVARWVDPPRQLRAWAGQSPTGWLRWSFYYMLGIVLALACLALCAFSRLVLICCLPSSALPSFWIYEGPLAQILVPMIGGVVLITVHRAGWRVNDPGWRGRSARYDAALPWWYYPIIGLLAAFVKWVTHH